MNLKKLTRIILLVAVLLLLSIVPVNAVVFNAAFDSDFYVNCYPDLKAAFGNDANAAYNHYLTYGIKEGRIASPVFDVKTYIRNYPDLQAAFGDNYEAAYNHFLTNGMKEGRIASDSFNVQVYIANYPDLQAAFGNDVAGAYNHYLTNGMAEGRVCGALDAGATAPEDHVHDYSVLYDYVKEPTCEEDGEAIYACSICGELDPETRVVKASHDYQEIDSYTKNGKTYTSKAAKCNEDGVQYYKCTVCEDITSEILAADPVDGHNYVVKVTAEENNGIIVYECSYCNRTYAETYNCEHDYEYISTTATCTASGVDTYVCTKCGATYTEPVSAKGHDITLNSTTIAVAKTCTTNGKAVGTCNICGKENVEMVIPASHEYYEADTNVKATCTEDGLVSKTCKVCKNTVYEITPATGHTEPTSGVVTYKVTPQTEVDEDGNTVYKTDDDGNILYNPVTESSETINLKTATTSTVNRARCVYGIVKVYTCPDCNTEVTETVYDVNGHKYVTKVNAKCTTEGKKVCSVCGDTQAIPATGHTLSGNVVKTSTDGVYYVNCKDCGIINVELGEELVIASGDTTGTITIDGKVWNVAVTYKEDGTTIQSIKIGEKVEEGTDEPDEIDTSALDAKKPASSLVPTDYTNWTTVQDAITAAETIASTPGKTQADFDAAVNAIPELEVKAVVDTAGKLAAAEQKVQDETANSANYSNWNVFTAKVTAARTLLDTQGTLQSVFDAAVAEIPELQNA